MWKKAGGLVLGSIVLVAVGGHGLGCDGSETTYAPLDACSGPSTGYPTYRPSFLEADVCTDAQFDSWNNACVSSSTATQADCDTFVKSNASCGECLYGNASKFGVFLDRFRNTPGYLTYLGKASQACVTAYHNVVSCGIQACYNCALSAVEACNTKILKPDGVCANENAVYTSACSSPSDQAAIEQARTEANNKALKAFVQTFCGKPIAVDAGADSGTDAGDASTDAASDASTDSGDASSDAPTNG